MSFMRIVQTFYTNCFKEGDSCRGWLSEESNLMCWALSCLKAKQFYDIVELYTDKHGEDILINQLNLPYDEVHVALDDASIFKKLPNYLWAMPKIYTYSLQTEPFIHIDGDFIFWKRYEFNKPLIFQNIEYDVPLYKRIHKKLAENIENTIFEDCLKEEFTDGAFNMGLFGGYNISFIREYASNALSYVINNYERNVFKEENNNINCFIEQFYISYLVKKKQLDYEVIHGPVRNNSNKDYELADFNYIHKTAGFSHFLGQSKSNHYVVDFIKQELYSNYIGYYNHIHKIYSNGIKKKYYFSPQNTEININDLYCDLMDRLDGDHYTISEELKLNFRIYLEDKFSIYEGLRSSKPNNITMCNYLFSAKEIKESTKIKLNQNYIKIKKYMCPWSMMFMAQKFVPKERVTVPNDFEINEKYCIFAKTPFESSLVSIWVNEIVAFFVTRVLSNKYITVKEIWEQMNTLVIGESKLPFNSIILLLSTVHNYNIIDISYD